MANRVLTPALAAAVNHAKTEAAAAGELRTTPAGSASTPSERDERKLIAAWRASGDYDRIVADIVAGDPDLAAQ